MEKLNLIRSKAEDISDNLEPNTYCENVQNAEVGFNAKYKDVSVSANISSKSVSSQTGFTYDKEKALNEKILKLQKTVQDLKQHQCAKNTMSNYENKLKENSKMCRFYTGMTFDKITMLYNFAIEDNEAADSIVYWNKTQKSERRRKPKLSAKQELILTLLRLKTGLLLQNLAYR